MADLSNLQKEVKSWSNKYKEAVEQKPERKDKFATISGITLKPLYTPLDSDDTEYSQKLGFPGEYPFTRGPYFSMHRGRLWTVRNLVGFEAPETLNRRQKSMIDSGQTGLSWPFCHSYLLGYDVDEVDKEQVGRTAVAINCLEDMEIAMDGIALDEVSTTIQDAGPFTSLAMYFALAEKRGIPFSQLPGTTGQADFLSHMVGCNMWTRFPPEAHSRMTTDMMVFCAREVPKWNMLSIIGQHMRETGADAAQEIGFTLSSGIFYLSECIKAGLNIDEFAPRISFFFNAGINIFEEVAKFRAARRMWAGILKERFRAKDLRSMRLRFHAQNLGGELTRQQPLNNIARIALQVLSAALGGAQSVHADSYEEAVTTPSEEGAKQALGIQYIVAEESGATDVIDPLGGSYYVERLTDELEEKAREYIDKIDSMGGMLNAVTQGYISSEVARSGYKIQRAIDDGDMKIVGVNQLIAPEQHEQMVEYLMPDPDVIQKQIDRVTRTKKERDQDKAQAALDELRELASGKSGSLFEAVMSAVKVNVTHGEICSLFRDISGDGKKEVMKIATIC